MAGRHRGRRYIPENDDSIESTAHTTSPSARSPPHHPTVAYYRPHGCNQPSGRAHDGYDDEEEEEDNEFRAGESSYNPLYEIEDDVRRFLQPSVSRHGSPNNNPLYGNDPFNPATTAAVCMTEFLKPKGRGSLQGQGYSLSSSLKNSRHFDDVGNFSDDEEALSGSRRVLPPVRTPPPRRNNENRLFAPARADQIIMRYPPARFSPVFPTAPADPNQQLICSPKGKRTKQSQPATSSGQWPKTQPQHTAPNIGDLIAAVRSDKNLLLGEVRKSTNREPRVPGDHDRYFSPRKGDIIIHFAPSLDGNKLVEYYDERQSMLRLQPGDKVVRVKYDNYKLPDHLLITSKLYLYAPEWVYLGKALQTIKTV